MGDAFSDSWTCNGCGRKMGDGVDHVCPDPPAKPKKPLVSDAKGRRVPIAKKRAKKAKPAQVDWSPRCLACSQENCAYKSQCDCSCHHLKKQKRPKPIRFEVIHVPSGKTRKRKPVKTTKQQVEINTLVTFLTHLHSVTFHALVRGHVAETNSREQLWDPTISLIGVEECLRDLEQTVGQIRDQLERCR